MRRYEQIYILRPSLSEDQITAVIENANQVVLGEDGAIIAVNRWGMRKLAYPIKKEPQGYYVLCDFAGTPGAVAEIERKFRIDDSVLKYLTVKLADSITAEEISAAKEEAESKAAHAAAETEESQAPAESPKAVKKPTEEVAAETAETDEKKEAGETEPEESAAEDSKGDATV
jgi:small subunit ribosomal protein S6